MCFLPNDIEGSVLGILGEVLKEGQPFTGHDIWKRCNAVDKVPAATDIRGVKRGMSDISARIHPVKERKHDDTCRRHLCL